MKEKTKNAIVKTAIGVLTTGAGIGGVLLTEKLLGKDDDPEMTRVLVASIAGVGTVSTVSNILVDNHSINEHHEMWEHDSETAKMFRDLAKKADAKINAEIAAESAAAEAEQKENK